MRAPFGAPDAVRKSGRFPAVSFRRRDCGRGEAVFLRREYGAFSFGNSGQPAFILTADVAPDNALSPLLCPCVLGTRNVQSSAFEAVGRGRCFRVIFVLFLYAADGGKGAEGSVLSYGRDDDLCRLLRSAVFLLQSYVDTADCVCNFQPENIKSDKK